jgi:ubiquinone/menaquinone biosynthesis C-methylase UbiE
VYHGESRGGHLEQGELGCETCRRRWPVRAGLPRLVDEAEVRGSDRFMRLLYDSLASLHDPAARLLLPVLQLSSVEALRDGYMRRLALARLRRPRAPRPLRILEVGIGGGANLPLIERDLRPDLDVDLWGVDLSEGMIRQCRRRLAAHAGRSVRLLLADAHALPFPDASFDRVFHVGGIAAFRDPRRALAEMARVARPGTPIVVVDEQLDPERRHGLYFRTVFRLLTFYDAAPTCPRMHLPAGARAVREEQLSRFYYCLTFRAPKGRHPRKPAGGRSRSTINVNSFSGPRISKRRYRSVEASRIRVSSAVRR